MGKLIAAVRVGTNEKMVDDHYQYILSLTLFTYLSLPFIFPLVIGNSLSLSFPFPILNQPYPLFSFFV